jgi:hypothetical protein
MRALITLLILTSGALALSTAIGGDSPDRPPGVSAADWSPISASLGVVLAPHQDAAVVMGTPQDLLLGGATEGYFMVKQRGVWQRLVLVNPVKGPGPTG